jgi:hypothetical protein
LRVERQRNVGAVANEKKVSSPAFEALVEELAAMNGDIDAGSLFGMPCLKNNGKAFVGSFDGGAVFKLGEPEHEAALGLEGSVLFDPSGKGRPMKEWVVVVVAHRQQWLGFAAAALAYVGG